MVRPRCMHIAPRVPLSECGRPSTASTAASSPAASAARARVLEYGPLCVANQGRGMRCETELLTERDFERRQVTRAAMTEAKNYSPTITTLALCSQLDQTNPAR